MSVMTAAETAAAATPAHRDRVIDAVRVTALLVVVLGHWLMAEITVVDGSVQLSNLLERVPALHLATWALQVMPLFFVAGGFANATVWHAGGGDYVTYLRTRVARLAFPVLVLAGIVPVLVVIARLAGLPGEVAGSVSRAIGQPLWFLAVYVVTTALAPAMVRWHARGPRSALATLLTAASVVEVTRMTTALTEVGGLNLLIVWLFAQQLGFWYADGRLSRLPRRDLVAVAAVSLAGLGLLTFAGPYPVSMVGLGGEMSNMDPPSICLVLLTIAQTSVLVLARPRLARWLERPRVWLAVLRAGAVAMTIYLWHLVAVVCLVLIVVAVVVELPTGGTALWWLSRPVWWGALAAVLAAIVLPVGAIERRYAPRRLTGNSSTARVIAGAACTATALAGYTFHGLEPFGPVDGWFAGLPAGPLPSTTCLVVGLFLVGAFPGRRLSARGRRGA